MAISVHAQHLFGYFGCCPTTTWPGRCAQMPVLTQCGPQKKKSVLNHNFTQVKQNSPTQTSKSFSGSTGHFRMVSCHEKSTVFQKSHLSSPGNSSSGKATCDLIVSIVVWSFSEIYWRSCAENWGHSRTSSNTSAQLGGGFDGHFGFWHFTKDAHVQLITSVIFLYS